MTRAGHIGETLLCVLLCAGAERAAAQERTAHLNLSLDADGGGFVGLWLDSNPGDLGRLKASLGKVLPCAPGDVEPISDDEDWSIAWHCNGAFIRKRLLVEGQVDLAPLLSRLRELSVASLRVNLNHPRAGFADAGPLRPARYRPGSYGNYSAVFPTDRPPPAPFQVKFGYRPEAAWRALAGAAGVILFPLALALWMRAAALRAPRDNLAAVWFSFLRSLTWLLNGTWLVWMVGVSALDTDGLTGFAVQALSQSSLVARAVSRWPTGLAATLVFFIPPLIGQVLCAAASHAVFMRIRGMEWTRGDAVRQAIWGQLAGVVPWICYLTAVFVAGPGGFKASVLWCAAGSVSWAVLRRLSQKAQDQLPQAITVGALRDRAFALADRAGVKLQQLYLVPGGKMRMANAFAAPGNNVLVTDYLLQHLSKREVDGVLAHELAHLKHRHPWKLVAAFIAGLVIMNILMGAALYKGFLPQPLTLPVTLAGAALATAFISRRMEHKADAGAVAVTGDPQAFITGQVKLGRLNLLPIDWSRMDGLWLTHPSGMRRVRAICRRAAVPPERAEEILRAPVSEEDHYEVPPAAVREEKVFSTDAVMRISVRKHWCITAVAILTPILAAYAARIGSAHGPAVWVLGLVATLALCEIVGHFDGFGGWRALERLLRAKLQRQGLIPERNVGLFVGFAPDEHVRIYTCTTCWDIGVLLFSPDVMYYAGEETRFSIRRDQVTAARRGPGITGWWTTPYLYLTWQDAQHAAGATFYLTPLRSRQALEEQVLRWWQGAAVAPGSPSSVPEPGAPHVGQVTSASLRDQITLRRWFVAVQKRGFWAAVAALLAGLPFQFHAGWQGAGWYVIFVAASSVVFTHLPFLFHREPQKTQNWSPNLPDDRRTEIEFGG